MKRALVVSAAAVAAFLPIAPASAEYCVTDNGDEVVCVAPEEWFAAHEPICVSHGSRPPICV